MHKILSHTGWLATFQEPNIKVKILGTYERKPIKILVECVFCKRQWKMFPQPINKGAGCLLCHAAKATKASEKRNRSKLISKGIIPLGDWCKSNEKLFVRNEHCGHEFKSNLGNLLHCDVECPICNRLAKQHRCKQNGLDQQSIYQETASEWNIYRHEVYAFTRQTYNDHHKTINPDQLIRGKAGVEGAFQLDHIVPVRFCFDNNIPIDICSHHTNLQMLSWEENISSNRYLKEQVPHIFDGYIQTKNL